MDHTRQTATLQTRWRNSIKIAGIAGALLIVAAISFFSIAYIKLSKQVDRRLAAGPLERTFSYFAAPETWATGDSTSIADLAAALKRSSQAATISAGAVTISAETSIEIRVVDGKIASIVDLNNRHRLDRYALPPQLITNLSDLRAKRTLVRYSDIPPVLIHAIVSAEDKRFFEHSGLDVLRITKAVYIDLRDHRKEQGASTISMQLARNLWLDGDKTWKRKMRESLITLHLERS
jgi:penicillin-binding protein 1B